MSNASYTQVTGKLINRQDAIDAARKCPVKEVTPAYMLIDKSEIMTELMLVPSAETDLIAKIQIGINATNTNDSYSCGMRNGMRLCMSLIDDKEPLFENCPSAERKRGKWIDDKCSACGYKCSACGYRVEPWNNTPYCPNCGADMRGTGDNSDE